MKNTLAQFRMFYMKDKVARENSGAKTSSSNNKYEVFYCRARQFLTNFVTLQQKVAAELCFVDTESEKERKGECDCACCIVCYMVVKRGHDSFLFIVAVCSFVFIVSCSWHCLFLLPFVSLLQPSPCSTL
jgi:hypothetical protein